MTNSLYQISSEMRNLLDMAFDAQGEIDDDLEARLELIEVELIQKTDNIVSWVESKKDMIELLKLKKKSIDENLIRINKSLESFDKYIESSLLRMGKKSIEGTLCKISMPKKRLVVQIDDESLLDLDFINIPPLPKSTPDKAKIKKALDQGLAVSGASMVESNNVSIKYGWK